MYRHVPDYYRSVSERVSNILDVIGYSQDDRDRQVMVANASELFRNIAIHFRPDNKIVEYVFGSRGEGSTGPELGSDNDILYVDDEVQLVEDLYDCQSDKFNYLMVHDDHTHPGYVKLQLVVMLHDNTPVPVFHHQDAPFIRVDSYNRTVRSNLLGSSLPGDVFSGPAIRTGNGRIETGFDNVYAFRCTQWPNEAHDGFQRRRLQGWPASHHLQNARKDSCFVVAVGHPHSCESDLEWRLSFSITERKLIRSFEDTVAKNDKENIY